MSHKSAKVHLANPFFYIALIYAAILGTLSGIITIAFIRTFELLQHAIWTYTPNQLNISPSAPWYVLAACVSGGLVVGFLVSRLGNYPISLEESLVEFKKNKTFDYQHIPQAIIISLASLGFGAALGPEAALTAIVGGLSTWIGLRIRFTGEHLRALEFSSIAGVMGGLFGSFLGSAALPLQAEKNELPKTWLYAPALVSAICAYYIFRLGTAGTPGYFSLQTLPYAFNATDILWTVPIALVGMLTGILFIRSGELFEKIISKVRLGTISKTVLGGLGLGLLAVATPLALFSGHEGLQTIVNDYGTTGGLALIGIGLAKVFAANICLSTGWKGGRFFPMMFAGAAVGLGLTHLLPIPSMLGLSAGMSAALAVLLRKPVLAILFVLFFFPPSLYLFVALAALFASSFSSRLMPVRT